MKVRLLFIILIIGFILRFAGIGTEFYWLDESVSVWLAQASFKTGLLDMVAHDVHPPMYMILLWGWAKFFGISPIATRLLSTIFSLMSLYMIFLVGKRLFSERVGLVAAAILAFSPMDIYYAQETRAYSFLVLLTLVSFYSFILLADRLSLRNSLLYFFSTLVLLYTHVFSLLIILVQNVYFLLSSYNSSVKIKKWILIQIHLFIFYLPWITILLEQMKESYLRWIPAPQWYTPLVTLANYCGGALLSAFFLTIAFFALIKFHWQFPWKKHLLLFLWIILPICTVFIFSLVSTPLFHPRYFLFTIPPLILIASWSLCAALKNRWALIAAVMFVIFLSLSPIYRQYHTNDKGDWMSASRFLTENVSDSDTIFVHPAYQQYPFTYYFNRQCFDESDIYACNYETKGILSLNLSTGCCNDSAILLGTDENNYLVSYTSKPMWIVDVQSQLHDKESNLYKYLNKTMRYQGTRNFYGISILEYRPME